LNVGHDRQLAGFGELSYNFTPALKATAGARLSKTDFTATHYADGPQNDGPDYSSGQAREKPFTPKLGLSWQVDDANMLYATYAKGFRIGGANAPLPRGCAADLAVLGLTEEPATYKSDTVQSYEIGAKDNIDNRLKLESSIYFIRWNGIQQNVYLPGCGLQFTGNFGQAVAKGFDLQADADLGGGLELEMAVGRTDARFTANSPGGLVLRGDAVTGNTGTAPPWTVTVGLEYGFQIASRESFVRLDWEYEQRNHELTAEQDPGSTQYNSYTFTTPATHFVSLRAGTKFDGWGISVFVDNLLDTHTVTGYQQSDLDQVNPNGSPPPLEYGYTTFRPRTIGIGLTYRK
jgi:iron complex outermembrane receptor protein